MNSGRNFRAEDSEAFANYREMIRQTSNEADDRAGTAGYALGIGAGAGIGSVIVGVEISPLIGAIGAIPTTVLIQNGVKNAIEAIRAGNKSSTMQALHHHDMYEKLVADEQDQGKTPGQPE